MYELEKTKLLELFYTGTNNLLMAKMLGLLTGCGILNGIN